MASLLEPSHYWPLDEVDDVRWDYIGNAHAMPYGGRVPVVATEFGNGVRPNDGTSISAKNLALGGTRSFTFGVRAQTTGNNDDVIIDSKSGGGFRIKINFNNNTQFQFVADASATNINLAYGANAGDALKLYWLSYDADTLTARAAINDGAWQSVSLSALLDVTTELFFGTNAFNRLNGETTIVEAVAWEGFLPSQAERADMYANWRDRTYFSNVLATPPAGPFADVTLVNMAFLSDATLVTAGQGAGTYWVRPYPLHAWDPVLAAAKGDYVWLRSTDHASTSNDGLFIGYSNSPAVPPTAWVKFLNAAAASAASGNTQSQLETADLTHHPDDPDGQPFRVSAQVVDSTLTQHLTGTIGSTAIYQTTILYKSADLETWEWHGALLPNVPAYVPPTAAEMFNHTGYMVKVAWGDGTWRAYSLLSDFWGSSYTLSNALLEGGGRGSVTHSTGRAVKEGWWTSPDGIAWTLLGLSSGKQGFFSLVGLRYAVSTENLGDLRSARVYKLQANGELVYPGWPIENWLLSENGGVWIQAMQIFCEGDTAHIYIKHGYQEPNGVIAYYQATLATERKDDMAAGNWIMYDAAKELFGGGLDLEANTLKMMLLDVGHTPNRATQVNYADISADELANGNGYATGGITLTSVSFNQTSGVVEFDCDLVEWTASGAGLVDVKWAAIYWDDGGSDPLLCYCSLETAEFDVAATQKLRVTPHANGILSLSGMT